MCFSIPRPNVPQCPVCNRVHVEKWWFLGYTLFPPPLSRLQTPYRRSTVSQQKPFYHGGTLGLTPPLREQDVEGYNVTLKAKLGGHAYLSTLRGKVIHSDNDIPLYGYVFHCDIQLASEDTVVYEQIFFPIVPDELYIGSPLCSTKMAQVNNETLRRSRILIDF